LDDARTRLWREDARTVLKLNSQRYDVIITEPSNPWTVGVGSVFSREFYEISASRLKPGGIMAQWFHLYETEDEIVDLVLRTFSSVFPHVEIWDTGSGDIILLGSMQPWNTGPAVFRKGFAIERVRTDMKMIDIGSPETLMARQLASQRTGFAITGPGPIQSDLFPILEYAAPRAFYITAGSRMLDRYDERTRQQLLMPPEKRAVLRALSLSDVQLVFGFFLTVNEEIWRSLCGAASQADVPCVFKTPFPSPPPEMAPGLMAEAARAFAAEDFGRADQLARFASQQNPDDAEAQYLLRVIKGAR
jgi:hypothetical protein